MAAYPQPPPLARGEIEQFLQEAPIARLCSHNEDGTIHVAPVWFRYYDGEIEIGTQAITRKVRNIRRDNRVSVMIDQAEAPYKAVLVYGTAQLEDEDAVGRRAAIFARYMPQEEAEQTASGLAERFEPMIIRVRPDRFVSFDYGK